MKKVLIAAPVHEVLIKGLGAAGYTCVHHERIIQADAYGLIEDCVGVITSTRLQLDKRLIDAAPRLRWIGRMGSGMEVINVPYAISKGIACYGSPEGNSNAVGEHAIGMLLALQHRIAWSNGELKNGIWLRDENRGWELEDNTVGIIGFGHTGQAFARKLQGFNVRIVAYDKYNPLDVMPFVECCDLEQVYAHADIVSFHVPLQEDTIHYFNDEFVAKMHKPFVLINTSRGKVVDTNTLAKGLASGKIKGACLDVYETEPVSAMDAGMRTAISGMINQPNVVMTPHIAGYTYDALYKMSKILLDKIVQGKNSPEKNF